MLFVRGFLLWSAIIPFAIANGALRDAVLVKVLGAKTARLCSGVILSAAVFVWTFLTLGWLPLSGLLSYAALGAGWLALTIAFEFSFGRLIAKKTWAELLRAYRCEGGDIWPVVLLVVALSPLAVALLRRHG